MEWSTPGVSRFNLAAGMYVSYHMLPAVLGYLVLLSASAVLLAYCTSTPAVPESILVCLCVCAYVHACVYHWDSGEGELSE